MEQEIVGPWCIGTPVKRKTFDLPKWSQRSWDRYKRRYTVDEDSVFIVAGYLKGGYNLWLTTPHGELAEGSINCFYPINPQSSLEDWA